jgi:hypothetical protein
MDAHDFCEEVRLKARRREDRPLLELLSQAYVAQGQHERRDIASCIQLANYLQAAGVQVPQESRQGTPVAARPTPEMRVRSERLRQQVEAWVEGVRTALFRQASPPFASPRAAIDWLEREVRRLYESIEASARALSQPVWDQALKASPRSGTPGTRATAQRIACLLEAIKAGKAMVLSPAKHLGLSPSELWDKGARDPVFQVRRQVKAMALATGFTEPDLVAYLLAGIRPTLAPATIAVQPIVTQLPAPLRGGEIRRIQVTIELHARDLSYAEHRALFQQLRQELDLVRTRGLTEEDRRFLQLAEHLGPPPSGPGSGAYWERFQRQWNKSGRAKSYNTPDGPRMRYGRLQQKLEALDLERSVGVGAKSSGR